MTHEIQATMPQKYLGQKGLIVFITLMNMFVPLSTDLYLPALPKMNAYFGSSSAITNLTLSIFFLTYAGGMLFWGPLSDKYGRKPILLIGSIIYILSSTSCALSVNVYFLIVSRALQGIGAGGIMAVSMAIIKDSFSGKRRETILAVTQSVSGLAPMLAPILGAFILKLFDWRSAFWMLVIISGITLILALLYSETLHEKEKYTGTVLGAMSRLVIVGRNKSFIFPALIFAIGSLSFMGYIALSSYVYIDYFHLSEQTYSCFFAVNSFFTILGPVFYVRFLMHVNKKVFGLACFGLSILSGILVMTVGVLSPVLFLGSVILMTLSMATMQPFSTNLLLNQQKGDSGSASSLIGTLFMVFGSVGMAVASLPTGNIVVGLGALITVAALISFIGWLAFIRSSIPCVGLKK